MNDEHMIVSPSKTLSRYLGYKMWGALLARVLTAAGILVVIPDYRNYPWAAAPGMIQDCQDALVWTREHVADYGGDANNIVVVGQSAGGHILLTTLLRRLLELSQAETQEEAASDITHTSWNPTDFKGFISLSAPYNLEAMTTTFMRHGLDRHLVDRIFGREERPKYDPFCILQELQSKTEAGMPLLSNGASLLLPPIRIYHGSKDKTVPQEGSVDFCRKLHEFMEEQQERKEVSFHSYEGWTHTDPILEAPMIADHRFHKDIFDAVVEWTDEDASRSTLIWPADDAILTRRLCPPCLVHAARFCNPF
jgi:prenylcysteine alpha-carboxyl methylesterase